jgi:hypothetical protein
MRSSLEFASSFSGLRKIAMTFALLLGAAQFAGSLPARAGVWDGGGPDGGADRGNDYGADHNDVYQVQRGDLVCNSRQACGGAAAIPMNRPGWFYLPRGTYLSQQPAALARAHRHKS